jgi:hypothetical protein
MSDTGGPAFPCSSDDGRHTPTFGMTMIEWYAGCALQGLLAYHAGLPAGEAAETAFTLATAMVAEAARRKA